MEELIQETDEPVQNTQESSASDIGIVTSFENISHFLASQKYPPGLNLNQKRTLRKAAVNFCLTGLFIETQENQQINRY